MVDDGMPTRTSRLRTVRFEQDTVDIIAETIGAEASLAPFQLPGAAVHQFTIAGPGNRPATMVTLWPSLRRVDAIGAGAAVVFTDIVSVQLVDGAEVLFRRGSGEYLVVTNIGKIVVRS